MGLMSAQNDTILSANSISLLFYVGSKGAQKLISGLAPERTGGSG